MFLLKNPFLGFQCTKRSTFSFVSLKSSQPKKASLWHVLHDVRANAIQAGTLLLAGPSEYLADLFAPLAGPLEPKDLWRKDLPEPSVVEIKEFSHSTRPVLAIHCLSSTELGAARGSMPILYVEAPSSGLWEARVAVALTSSEISAGFTLVDRDGMMPDLLFGLDTFSSRGWTGGSGGLVALRYAAQVGLTGPEASEDLTALGGADWVTLKLVRTGTGRYDLFYMLSNSWLAPDDVRNSDAGVRPRVYVKTVGVPSEQLFTETEWRPLARQLTTAANGRRIGLYTMTGNSGTAKFKDFLVRDLFPQSVASFHLDDVSVRESLDSAGTPVTGSVSAVVGRDGYSQGALLFTDGTQLNLPIDPLELDTYTNDSLHEFTISLWVKPYSSSAGGLLGRRLAQHLPELHISPSIFMSSSGLEWSMLDETGQNYTQSFETPHTRPYASTSLSSVSLAPVLEVNEWTHLAFVKEADTVVFYQNGQRWGFAALAPDLPFSDSSGVFLLNYLQEMPYHGALDDVRFFDIGLADFAVEHLFSNANVDTLRGKTQRCIAGTLCSLVGVTGPQLADQNHYAVLAQCGRLPALDGLADGAISDASGAGTVHWGSLSGTMLTAPGGKYQICWCAVGGTGCTAPSEFRVLVGTLVVVGPYTQERTCVLGQVASFEILGMELDAGDQVQILETCGVPSDILNSVPNRLPLNGTADLQPSSCFGHIGLGVVETTALHAHGSGLTGKTQDECCSLCERSLYGDCVAWVHRPSDLTCFLYRTVGSVERQEDRVCGFSNIDWQPSSPVLLATTLTGNRPGANSSGPFRLYVCRSNLECHFGTALSLSNLESYYQSFQVITTWPADWEWNAVKIFSDTADRWFLESLVVTAHGISWNFTYSGWLESGSEVYLMRDVTTSHLFGSSWGAEAPSMAPGGRYRLCWCRPNSSSWSSSNFDTCLDASDFQADAGVLTFQGPSPLEQHLTCLSGQACPLLGLTGTALAEGDKIMVLNTCGQIWDGISMSHPSLVPRVTGSCRSSLHCLRDIPCDDDQHSLYERPSVACGISDPAVNGGADYTWGGVSSSQPFSAPGGIYKICWCAFGQTCSMFEHFKVELGELSLAGPSLMDQHRTCVAGQACVVSNIQGYRLENGDKIMILDECGQVAGQLCPQDAANGSLGCLTVTDRWPGSTAGGPIGLSEPAISSAHPCGSSMTWSPFHPSSSCYAVFTSPLTWADAEAACDVIYGGHLASISSQEDVDFLVQWIMDTGETYWIGLSDQATEGTFVYSDGSSFAFSNWGTLQPALTLSNTEDCVYLDSDGFFFDDACTGTRKYLCERAGAFTGAMPGDEFRFGGYQTPRESLIPPSSAGGQYRLCWCASGQGAQCSQAEDFRMDFGVLTLLGPAPLFQHKTCVAGQVCELKPLQGTDLQDGDLVHILETCGYYVNASQFSHFDSSSDSGLHLPRFPSNNGVQSLSQGATSGGSTVSWGTTTITAAGGRYRLCWCAAGYSCSAVPEFRVDFGRSPTAERSNVPLRKYFQVPYNVLDLKVRGHRVL